MKRLAGTRHLRAPAAALLAALACLPCGAQQAPGAPEEARTYAALNLVGAAVTMPPAEDTMWGTRAAWRRALARKGILFRVNSLPRVSVNLLDGPAAKGEQAYIGHRPTWITGLHPILTLDLRQLGLKGAQLNVSGAWRWTTWKPAGPNAVTLATLHLYKEWGDGKVEMKTGYVLNDLEFIGMQVGGSLAVGAQGVYAVLPFQAGMSFFPFTAPSLNFRFQLPRHFYVKTAVQRSLDAGGAIENARRNPSGFRFVPHGTRALFIDEAGYRRAAGDGVRQVWVRAGALYNTTPYVNRATLERETGNGCYYLLADVQLRQAGYGSASRGTYAGASWMSAPSRFNAYDRYFEARLYQIGPFRSRGGDTAALVYAWRRHSPVVTGQLAAAGRTYWEGSPAITGSYTYRAAAGNYITVALGYTRGAAITPRVKDALVATVSWGMFF